MANTRSKTLAAVNLSRPSLRLIAFDGARFVIALLVGEQYAQLLVAVPFSGCGLELACETDGLWGGRDVIPPPAGAPHRPLPERQVVHQPFAAADGLSPLAARPADKGCVRCREPHRLFVRLVASHAPVFRLPGPGVGTRRAGLLGRGGGGLGLDDACPRRLGGRRMR